jgi:hypothetical protein
LVSDDVGGTKDLAGAKHQGGAKNVGGTLAMDLCRYFSEGLGSLHVNLVALPRSKPTGWF